MPFANPWLKVVIGWLEMISSWLKEGCMDRHQILTRSVTEENNE